MHVWKNGLQKWRRNRDQEREKETELEMEKGTCAVSSERREQDNEAQTNLKIGSRNIEKNVIVTWDFR